MYLKYDFDRIGKNLNILNLIRCYFSTAGIRAVILYRLSNFLYKKKLKILAALVQQRNIKVNSCEIGYETEIDRGLLIAHTPGIIISGNSKIGKNVTIRQGVTIGEKNGGAPVIEDGVVIGAGSVILGKIKIGKNSQIGANAVVLTDVPEDSIMVGIPAKNIKTNKL